MENELSKGARQALDLLAENPAQVLYIVQDYDRLAQRVEELERRMRENNAVDARRSSIEVGTPAKGGNMKVYFDPFASAIENDRAVEEAQRILAAAGGKTGGA